MPDFLEHAKKQFFKLAKEADLLTGMRTVSVFLADPAVPSATPVRPKKTLNTILGLIVGLMSGLATALILEAQRKTLSRPEDVERFVPNASLLGVLPLLPEGSLGVDRVHRSGTGMSPLDEGVRFIRTNLLFANPERLPSSLMVTSPGESEGKTTLAVNLSMALAQLEGAKVVLIDADLRRPTHHRVFDLQRPDSQTRGLVEYLEGKAEMEDIIYRTGIPGLSVIPAGMPCANPSELLHTKRMGKVLDWFRKEGFHIVVDTPPVLPVSDPLVIASQVDGVLMVISAGETTKDACRLAIQRLALSGGKILGLVMQKASADDTPYYSSYYYSSPQDAR